MLVIQKRRHRRYPDLPILGRNSVRAWAGEGPAQARLPFG
jgi:hypothetical protein